MSVIAFPGRRQAPPKAAVDELLDELTAIEIDLARARLAQIKQETRHAQALWGWWCLKRCLVWGCVLWVIVTCAKAEERKTFYDRNGSFAGTSLHRGNSGSYYNGQGRFSGSSMRSGNQTMYYDSQGRYSGSTISTGRR